MSSDRSRYNQAEFVVEEAVAVGEAKVQLRLFAHPVVAGSGGGGNGTLVGGVLGDEVDAAPMASPSISAVTTLFTSMV